MSQELCQSCGMPLSDESLFGLESNGIKSEEYCKFCYVNGNFNKPDETLEEMIISCIPFMVKEGITDTEARKNLELLLPKLKRWSNKL
ncbi:MAG: zinc ribbon domain-containing protein [Spirochaetaceae bacterium]